MSVLTSTDHAFFAENGYLHVPHAVPKKQCAAVVSAMYEFLDFDRRRPDTWYRPPLKPGNGGMVELYHHQSLWDNRQHPRLHKIFAEILHEKNLHCSLDRVSMKLPMNPRYPDWVDKGFLHIDVPLPAANDVLPANTPIRLQGVIYLTDTTENQGGFHCVPGFNHRLRSWAQTPPSERLPAPPDFSSITPTPVAGGAGDLIVWDVFLPHGNGLNATPRPRFAQYVLMFPAKDASDQDRSDRVRRWSENLPTFSGDPRKIEETSGKAATLTPLGRRLLGLDAWD